MARENIFTEFDLEPSDPEAIDKMIDIATGDYDKGEEDENLK